MIAGIGQCSWDIIGMVDSYPAPDSKEEILQWEEQGGGPVATALVTAARLGYPGRFYGVVGDDAYGEKIRRSLAAGGIDIGGVTTRCDATSQVAFIAVERGSGRRTIFWQRASGRPLQPEELPPAYLDGASFLLLDGLMAEVSLHAALEARKLGVPVMLDAGRVRPGMVEIAPLCDYLVAAEQFALDLGWDGDPERFRTEAKRLCPGVVTVTLGERGSVTWAGDEIIRTSAFPVEAIDTTGAGDVFHGAYACGVLKGWPLPYVLSFASAAAALKCTRVGGRAGIPTVGTVLAFMEERETTRR
ncbi:MAG TPA: PfkB family carbohydrate kinase [Geobacteraceae bacterium]|nr:PfkB family carbohydrate kinase [Geobacteraceae bacterium]